MKITYIGLIDNKFKYQVTLNGHTFDYWTGLGWCELLAKSNPDTSKYARLDMGEKNLILKIDSILRNKYNKSHNSMLGVFRKIPSEADVLECLKADCEAGNMSFYDFCDNFGYDKDSIEALNIHIACMKHAEKLRGYAFPETNEGE